MTKKREVLKHRAAIQTTGTIGLTARRAYNVLLAYAWDTLKEQEIQQIPMETFMAALHREKSQNWQWAQAACRELTGTAVEWNILDKEGKKEWGSAALLAEAKISSGILRYAYSPKMREMLSDPRIYTRINLLVQSKFQHKHSLVLYEICSDFKNVGSTGVILVEELKELFGLIGKYPTFGRFNQAVLQPALQEINTAKNNTGIKVKMLKIKEGRNVIGVKFSIKTTEQKIIEDSLAADIPAKPTVNSMIAKANADNEEILAAKTKDAWKKFNSLPPEEQNNLWKNFDASLEPLLRPMMIDERGRLAKNKPAVLAAFKNALVRLIKD